MKTCPACGAQIDFIRGPSGRAIPVQKVRTVYARAEGADVQEHIRPLGKVELPKGCSYWVNHFETCSDPNRFSGGRR